MRLGQELSGKGAETLAKQLGFHSFSEFTHKEGERQNWRHFMRMILDWERKVNENDTRDESEQHSRKEMSQKLMDAAVEADNEDDHDLLQELARTLDFTGWSLNL